MKIDSEFVEEAARIIVIIVVDRVTRVTSQFVPDRIPAPVDRREIEKVTEWREGGGRKRGGCSLGATQPEEL